MVTPRQDLPMPAPVTQDYSSLQVKLIASELAHLVDLRDVNKEVVAKKIRSCMSTRAVVKALEGSIKRNVPAGTKIPRDLDDRLQMSL
eukprot:3821873-Karenia_brevis.AAC.1